MMEENIAVLYGRFQPFTVNDLEKLKKLAADTGGKVVLAYIRSHQGYANTPFRSSTVRKMLEVVRENYPELVECVASVESWQLLCAEHPTSYVLNATTVESDHNSIKASIARMALTMGVKEEFFRMVPECLRTEDMYQLLRDEELKYSK